MTNELTTQEQERIKEETHSLVVQAQGLAIKTEMDNTKAAQLTAAIKAEIKTRKASDMYTTAKESKDASKRAFDSLEAMLIDPLKEAVEIITPKIGAFVQAENARRAQLQAIEDAKVAEAQRKADEKAAKAQRKADEAYAAKCAKAAELNKPAPVAPAYVPPPVIVPRKVIAAVSAPGGTTYREYWSAEVISIRELNAAISKGIVDDDCVIGNMPFLNNLADQKKIEGVVIPGVLFKKRTGTSQRS